MKNNRNKTNRERFEAAFSEEYRAMLQKRADEGMLGDVTEYLWMAWQHAMASGL